MKKLISMLLALVMVFGLTACGSSKPAETEAPTDAAPQVLEGTMEELVNQIVEKRPTEFMGGFMPVDLTDTSEDGLSALKYNTGLDNADQLSDAAVFEPMMGSIAFSLVMVRVNENADAKAVAEAMQSGIDTRKWICVEAEELVVCGFGDVVMLVMGSGAQNYVEGFRELCASQFEGAELDFVLE